MNTRKPTIGLFVLLFCVLVTTAGCGKKFIRGASESSESVDGSVGTFAQERAGEGYGDAGNPSVLGESLEPLENVLPLGEDTMPLGEDTNSAYASSLSDDERARMNGETGIHAAALGQGRRRFREWEFRERGEQSGRFAKRREFFSRSPGRLFYVQQLAAL